ncbi:hypothetical protein [Streptomyces sp. NBC_00111]|uniref:hypothetical protein n=1 Tax=unclassified Streptomyces TaxID=2593676 RepID=UPI0038669C7A
MTLPRRRGSTEQAADAAMDTACRQLRLPSIGNEIAERTARDQMTSLSWPHTGNSRQRCQLQAESLRP